MPPWVERVAAFISWSPSFCSGGPRWADLYFRASPCKQAWYVQQYGTEHQPCAKIPGHARVSSQDSRRSEGR